MTASASIKNPQTFNRYSYVLNSPYKYTDPLGLIAQGTGSGGNSGGLLGKECDLECRYRTGQLKKSDYDLIERHLAYGTNFGIGIQNALQSSQQSTSGTPPPAPNGQNVESGNEATLEDNIPGNENVGIEIIIWDELEWQASTSLYGHVSAVLDGISYSWENNGMNKDTEPNNYINQRRRTSGGTGYILDFGSKELNDKFKKAYLDAYNGTGDYNVAKNNCGHAFLRAINTIAGELGIKQNDSIKPNSHGAYIQKILAPYLTSTNTYMYVKGEGRSKK